MRRLEARVYGHVQGVFFRDTTRREATRLSLTGWVSNEPDGSVRVVAEGDEEALRLLEVFLRRGSPAACVSRVETKWSEATGAFRGFRVRA